MPWSSRNTGPSASGQSVPAVGRKASSTADMAGEAGPWSAKPQPRNALSRHFDDGRPRMAAPYAGDMRRVHRSPPSLASERDVILSEIRRGLPRNALCAQGARQVQRGPAGRSLLQGVHETDTRRRFWLPGKPTRTVREMTESVSDWRDTSRDQ